MAVVLFLSAISLGALILLGSSALLIRHSSTVRDARRLLEEEARLALNQLARQTAAEVDSPFDPVWTWAAGRKEGTIGITLEDVSSQLNLNTVRTEVFEKTELGKLLALGHSARELRQYRADKGPFASLASYAAFFPSGVLASYFTVYGYINVNTTFEDVLRGIFAARTGDKAAAEAFRNAIRGFLVKQEMVGKEQLASLFGLYYPQLYPLMNVEPQMNVNFIPPEILHALLAYPYGGKSIENFEGICNAILSERQQQGLTPQYLSNLIHAQGEQLLIFQYLGTRTWFWRITVRGGSHSLVQVVARIPDDQKTRFALLENHFQ